MQISLGNSFVSAVIYNDSAVRKENSVIAQDKNYKSEFTLGLRQKNLKNLICLS